MTRLFPTLFSVFLLAQVATAQSIQNYEEGEWTVVENNTYTGTRCETGSEGEVLYWYVFNPPNLYQIRIPKDDASLTPANKETLLEASQQNHGVQVEIEEGNVVSVEPNVAA